jgi:hypothetical protein
MNKDRSAGFPIVRWLVDFEINGSPPVIKVGDINGDGKVDIFDYNLLVTKFGNPYTIFDYNQLVSNYGK